MKFLSIKSLLVALIFTLVTGSCDSQQKDSIQQMQPAEFAQLIQTEDVRILDVRTPAEFKSGHVRGAVPVNVQDDAFLEQVQSIYSDKSKPVYVYCKSGRRSMMAAEQMVKAGYTHVINVLGGIDALPANIQTKEE
mgnify:FL=1